MGFELAKAYVTVAANMSGLTAGMHLGESVVKRSVSAMQGSLNTLSGTIAQVGGMFGVSLGVYGLYNLGKSIIFASDATSMLRNSFITMYKGSEEQADALIKRMKEFAATTPFEEAQVSRAIMMFKPFSKDMDDMFETIRKIGDAASTSAQGLQAFPRVALAISQMFGKTKISAQEMQQMAEGGVPAWEALAKSQGKSVAEVMKLSATGKLGTDAIRAMIDELGRSSAGAMEKQSKTITGLLSTISDNVKLQAVAAFKPLYEAVQGTFTKIAAYASSPEFAKMMTSFAESVKSIIEKLKVFGGRIATWWGGLNEDFKNSIKWTVMMSAGMAVAIPLITTLSVLMKGLIPIVVAVGAAVLGGKLIWQKWGETIKSFIPELQGIMDALSSGDLELAAQIGMAGVQAAFFEAMDSVTTGWLGFVKDLISTFADGIRAIIAGFNKLKELMPKDMLGPEDWIQSKGAQAQTMLVRYRSAQAKLAGSKQEFIAEGSPIIGPSFARLRKESDEALIAALETDVAYLLKESGIAIAPQWSIEKKLAELAKYGRQEKTAESMAEMDEFMKMATKGTFGTMAEDARRRSAGLVEKAKIGKQEADRLASENEYARQFEEEMGRASEKNKLIGAPEVPGAPGVPGTAATALTSSFLGFADLNRKMQEALMKDEGVIVAKEHLEVAKATHAATEKVVAELADFGKNFEHDTTVVFSA